LELGFSYFIDEFYSVNEIKIMVEETQISNLADEENVQWIDVIEKTLQTHNDGNRQNVGVDTLQVSPYNLNGNGIVTSQWDGGWADTTHDDFIGRLTVIFPSNSGSFLLCFAFVSCVRTETSCPGFTFFSNASIFTLILYLLVIVIVTGMIKSCILVKA